MIQVINFLTDYLLVKSWDIPLSSILGGSIDENSAERSKDFSLVQMSALSNTTASGS